MLEWYKNIPLFSILISLAAAIITPLIKNKKCAAVITTSLIATVLLASVILSVCIVPSNEVFIYQAGYFSAPWGNELKCGVFESVMASVFAFVMLFSVFGGLKDLKYDLENKTSQYYYMMLDLLLASMLAIIYSNDIFTCYVFIEINTVGAFFIVMAKEKDDTYLATVRYFIVSMLASGLILFSIAILYTVTGHLNMLYLFESIQLLWESGSYRLPVLVAAGMMCVGLTVKSALFPFHAWLPKASSAATVTSSAILSSLITKGYIVLLIKVFYRVFGIEFIRETNISNVLFVFGVIAMIYGSVKAMRQTDIKKMIACSSISQIGYIYAGIGLASPLGLAAAVYHIITHAVTKADMFLIAGNMISYSKTRDLRKMRDIGPKMPVTMAMFVICALSMIGIPLLMGFISKWNLAQAAIDGENRVLIIALTLSTLLNASYYFPPIIRGCFSKEARTAEKFTSQAPFKEIWSQIVLTLVIVLMGLFSAPLSALINTGLADLIG